MSVEGMHTPEELEEIFEVPQVFAEESPNKTWARFDWLRTRQEAEFLLFLVRPELGLTPEQLRDIYGAFNYAVGDYNDFMVVGCGLEFGEQFEDEVHPLSNTIAELTMVIDDGIDELVVEANPEKMRLEGYGGVYEDLGTLEDEEIIHMLTQLRDKYPSTD